MVKWSRLDHAQEALAVSDSATPRYDFATVPLPLAAAFDGGRLTSDGGLPWLATADTELGLCEALAAVIPEWRRGSVRHALVTLVRQRVYQLACGYEDQNDANTLRGDPLLKLVCERLPETDPDLAGQSTLSRFENALHWRTCYRLAYALAEGYLREREREGVPKRIVLDCDSTDDPVHGHQEGERYHGYYRQHMYHPLLIFDGDTHQVISVVLRPGNAHASRGAVRVLTRLVRLLRERWPDVAIELRADSGLAVPAVYTFLERERLPYTIGLGTNPRLQALAAELQARAQQQRAATDAEKVTLFGEAAYRAESWEHPRRVVIKAEALPKGPNTRFVVTCRDDPPEALYRFYTQRGGDAEGPIKDFKRACFGDRLSCHRFVANQVRLLLSAAAYTLLHALRRWLVRLHRPALQLDTLRLQLLKIGGRVKQRLSDVRLALATSHPSEPLWAALAAARPPGPIAASSSPSRRPIDLSKRVHNPG
jgi:DDE family transposase